MTEILVTGPCGRHLSPPAPVLTRALHFHFITFFISRAGSGSGENATINGGSWLQAKVSALSQVHLLHCRSLCSIALFCSCRIPARCRVLESHLGNSCCKTFLAQLLMNTHEPCKVLLHCPFTLLLTWWLTASCAQRRKSKTAESRKTSAFLPCGSQGYSSNAFFYDLMV